MINENTKIEDKYRIQYDNEKRKMIFLEQHLQGIYWLTK